MNILDLNRDRFLNSTPKTRQIVADMQTLHAYKNKLAESDYKITKSEEYELAGLELPYDMEELHAEREAIREKIRELEERLA